MSLTFIHSADWQLGARFTQFGTKAELLRNARLQTLETALNKGEVLRVDAFLIAGDLFEDNQVDDSLVISTLSLFAKHPELHIIILPGNHDPATGPGSVWERSEFTTLPSNVIVLKEPGFYELADGYLIASPLKQKISTHDPSLKIAEIAHNLPADRIKVGITHGAIAIPGKHQSNDFPIALDASSRAGLDYLAIGCNINPPAVDSVDSNRRKIYWR
ncbi:MAG TPA: metallophosphoesterase [Phycisphaerae bacterium]|nr:metallophosphoesterase [Phycisphaerae bacterium]